MSEEQPNTLSPIHQAIEDHLNGHVDSRAREWVARYAYDAQGKPDPALAYRIDREVHRRGAIGKQLDIYEPLRWTGISWVLTAAVGAVIKLTQEKKISTPALITLAATTGLYSSIQLLRLLPRYDAGLRGGVDTAMTMHEFDTNHAREAENHAIAPPGTWAGRVTEKPPNGNSIHQFDV